MCANLSPGRNWLCRRYSCGSIHVNVTIVIAVMFLAIGRYSHKIDATLPFKDSLSHHSWMSLNAVCLTEPHHSQKLEQKEDDIEEVAESFVSTKHLIKLHVLGHHHLPWPPTYLVDDGDKPPSLLLRIHYRPICHKRARQTPHNKSTNNNVWDASELHALGIDYWKNYDCSQGAMRMTMLCT